MERVHEREEPGIVLVVEELIIPPLAPQPGIREGGDLRLIFVLLRLLEQDIVVAGGVEGRIEIDEINRLVRDMLPHDRQVVAIVKSVFHLQVVSAGGRAIPSEPAACRRYDSMPDADEDVGAPSGSAEASPTDRGRQPSRRRASKSNQEVV